MPSTELASQVAQAWHDLPGTPLRLRVGFSGGLDSSVLLHLLAGLRPGLGFELSAIHVHHGLQAAATDWAAHCCAFGDGLGVPVSVTRVSLDPADARGLEAAARDARRGALMVPGADVLALAHHADDQAETVLFRALRGAGVRGAAGMRVIVAGEPTIWRPLLDVPRQVLLDYARNHQLRWVDDPSNGDVRFSRNFLRHQILPPLQTRFPGARGSLLRLGRLSAEASDLLDDLADGDLATLAQGNGGRFGRPASLGLSPARLRNVLRRVLARSGVDMPEEVRLVELERQFRASGAEAGWRGVMGAAAVCVYRQEWWLEPGGPFPVPERRRWQGEHVIDWGGGQVKFLRAQGEGMALVALTGQVCELRRREGGERLRLRAESPSRSLKQLFQEAAVPPWWRPNLPLFWVDGRLAWVAGMGVATEFACPPGEPGLRPVWTGVV